MRITRAKKIAMAALVGLSLGAGVASAGTETDKLVAQIIVSNQAGYFVVLQNPEASTECSFALISIPEDVYRPTRIAMLIAAKMSGQPVSILYNVDPQYGCVLYDLRYDM